MLNQRWNITINNLTWESNAVPTDGARIDYSMVTDQQFYRQDFNGRLKFQREDYTQIMAANFDTKIQVDLEEYINGVWTNTYTGSFTRTDCNIDEDKEILDVKPKTEDRYTKFMDAMDKEYNIVDVVPKTQELDVSKRPVVQIYLAGSNKLMNYVGGSWWTQDVQEPTTDGGVIMDDYKFGHGAFSFIVPGVGDGLTPDVSGQYNRNPSTYQNGEAYIRSDNAYKFKMVGLGTPLGSAIDGVTLSGGVLDDYDDFYSVWSDGTNNWVYIGYYEDESLHMFDRFGAYNMPSPPFTLTHVSGATNTGDLTVATQNRTHAGWRWTIQDAGTGDNLYVAPVRALANNYPYYTSSTIFTSLTDSSSKVKVFAVVAYARIISNADSHNIPSVIGDDTLYSTNTENQPENDIVPKNENFEKVLPVPIDDIVLSDDNQTAVENYGKFADDALHFSGLYHQQQTHSDPIFPVLPDEWTEYSIWVYFPTWLQNIQSTDYQTLTIDHVFKLSNVVKYLLNEIDTTLTHDETDAYSDFFYGASNSIRGTKRYPLITPKSNVLAADYDEPARKAELKVRELFDMLRNVYNVYPDITHDNKFILEHIDFYDRGGTYNGTNLGVDLTVLIEPKTGKTQTHGTNKYTFDKQELYSEVKWDWADDVSDVFEGSPMIFSDEYVEDSNVKEISISKFSTDIDYALVQPSTMSNDGFFLFDADLVGTRLTLPLLSKTVDSIAYSAQNGYLAMMWLQENYLKYNLSATNVTINGTATTANSIKRNKIQEISTVIYAPIIEPMRLIVTGLGNGKIESLSRALNNSGNKIKLRHETES